MNDELDVSDYDLDDGVEYRERSRVRVSRQKRRCGCVSV